MTLQETLLIAIVAAPGVLFLTLSAAWLAGASFPERFLARASGAVFAFSGLGSLLLAGSIFAGSGPGELTVSLGNWFSVGDYEFPLELLADWLSLPLMAVTAILIGLVTKFASRYLHRERGYLYFFLLLQAFGFGSLLLFAAASFDLLVAGWEIVGWTSVLLISFFSERRGPAENGLRVFSIYRVTDIGLLVAVVALHHFAGTTSVSLFSEVGPNPLAQFSTAAATGIGLCFLFAAMGKAAQYPFSGWLPRAMEGPTPSSAIFYGAISVHAGAFLLLRAEPILSQSAVASWLVIAVGVVSAVAAIMAGRASSDIKGSLAYASIAQLGIIFVEIGFGFSHLAVWHICSHAIVRTLQILRAPSALYEFHQVRAAAGGKLQAAGEPGPAMFPQQARLWLYRFALKRADSDTLLDRFVARPVLALASLLNPSSDGTSMDLNEAFYGQALPRPLENKTDALLKRII